MDKKDVILEQMDQHIIIIKWLETQTPKIIEIADVLIKGFKRGNKVLLFGNGGSSDDAQHIACEFAGKFYRERDPLPAIALNTNVSTLTAIANDYGYQEVFARQIKGLVKDGDIIIGISTSGNSSNVIRGIEEAQKLKAITVVLTGQGGKLNELADYAISIPSKDTPRIQEAHITVGHVICYLVEQGLYGDSKNE